MKARIFLIVILPFSIGACSRIKGDEEHQVIGSCGETVEAVARLRPDVDFGKLMKEGVNLGESFTGYLRKRFNPNDYFRVLPHLSMEPGCALDVVVHSDRLGQRPVLYARRAEAVPFSTFSEYSQASGPFSAQTGEYKKLEYLHTGRYRYLEHVRTDGSAEGFFQLAVLRIMGDQFGLFWHGNYEDDRIICSQKCLEAVFPPGTDEDDLFPWDLNSLRESRRLDLNPEVELSADTVNVKLYTYTGWGGLELRSFIFKRPFPHTVIEESKTVVVEYWCGIMF